MVVQPAMNYNNALAGLSWYKEVGPSLHEFHALKARVRNRVSPVLLQAVRPPHSLQGVYSCIDCHVV